ncbi:MAG: dipeptide/oligopeptide/nickel ABC transporter permease [Bacteroidetes bacterium]|nr:MAG: dipeptide/oligopeptide/nickel ABC transporter permease [Bacteroidota bacterium]
MMKGDLKAKKSGKERSYSLSRVAWQRLRRNKLSMTGLFIIVVAIIISMLGYLITPDSSPDTDIQIHQLAIQKPGFTCDILYERKNEESHKTNFFNKMIWGEQSDYKLIPVYGYYFEDNDIVVEEYTATTPNNGTTLHLNLADVAYAIDPTFPVVNDVQNGVMEFYAFGSKTKIRKTRKELQAEVKLNLKKKKFVLGTDRQGRDMLSRLMIGTRISLFVGLVSVLISVVIGIFMGALSGFFRGWVDDFIMWLINVVWSIPTLLLVIAITLVLGKGIIQVFIAVGLTMWVETARVVRGQILSVREKEYIEAGRSLGFGNMRLIFRHVLPNVMGPVVVISAMNFANAILIEAGLSFLGIGAQPPTPSWGAMINDHRGYILVDAAYLAIVPGLAIMLIVLAFMFLGNGLRDAIDSKMSDEDAIMGT